MDRLTSDEYGAWRQHPATQKYRQYLRDYRARLMEQWGSGQEMTKTQQAYAQVLGDLDLLTFEDIEAFYESQEKEADDGDEGGQP